MVGGGGEGGDKRRGDEMREWLGEVGRKNMGEYEVV